MPLSTTYIIYIRLPIPPGIRASSKYFVVHEEPHLQHYCIQTLHAASSNLILRVLAHPISQHQSYNQLFNTYKTDHNLSSLAFSLNAVALAFHICPPNWRVSYKPCHHLRQMKKSCNPLPKHIPTEEYPLTHTAISGTCLSHSRKFSPQGFLRDEPDSSYRMS